METNRNKILSVGIAALILASSPVASMAQSDRQKDKNNMRNLGAGLGGAALYELLKGNGTAGVLLGAGAAYAGKKYEDERKAQAKRDQNRERREHTYRYNHTGLSYSGDQGMTRSTPQPQPIDVLVNKEKVAFPNERGAEVIGGNTYVPLRGVMEKLGATVNYNPDTKTVTAVKGDKTVKLPYNDFAMVNGKQVKLDAPAFISNGQAMIPLRFMAQTFGANVNWDTGDHAVHIDSTGAA